LSTCAVVHTKIEYITKYGHYALSIFLTHIECFTFTVKSVSDVLLTVSFLTPYSVLNLTLKD